MNLQRIGHFLAVVEAGSLGRATVKVGLSQPALTKSIRKLEEEVGFALFDRAGSLVLTAPGEEFLRRALRLMGEAGDLEREMDLLRGGRKGVLKVVCGATMAETSMAPALAGLVNRRPGLRIEVRIGDFRELPGLLRDRKIDLGVGEYTTFEHEKDLEIIPLPAQEIVFVCRAGHPLAKRRKGRVAVAEFFSYPLVATGLPDWAVRWLRENHPERAAADGLTVTCNHYPLLKSIIMGSDAVTGVPEGVVRAEMEAGTLVRIRLDAPGLVNRAGIVYLRGRSLSPASQLLVEALSG